MTYLLGAARLLTDVTDRWRGTVAALFPPAEEIGGPAARGMLDGGLCGLIPAADVALTQHVLPFPAGQLATGPGPVLSAADNTRITVHGAPALGGRERRPAGDGAPSGSVVAIGPLLPKQGPQEDGVPVITTGIPATWRPAILSPPPTTTLLLARSRPSTV